MPKTLNASSISPSPLTVSVAACKPSMAGFILAIADDSLAMLPPGKMVRATRPDVAFAQAAPMSANAVCHGEFSGASVASLSRTGACAESEVTADRQRATTRIRRVRDMTEDLLRKNAEPIRPSSATTENTPLPLLNEQI